MSKKRKKPQTDTPKPTEPEPLTKIQHPFVAEQDTPSLPSANLPVKRPVLGMSLMKITGAYSMQALHDKNADKRRERYQELERLQRDMATLSVRDFFERYPHSGGNLKNIPKDKQKILDDAKKEAGNILGYPLFDNDDYQFMHIHTRPNGTKGAFTLFGFQYENVFEILLLDPEHEIL